MPFARDAGLPVLATSGDAVAKATRTITGSSAWIDIGDARELVAQIHSDAGTGTAPTLDVKLQTSYDGADATAIDVPSGAFTQVAAAASAQIKTVAVFHRYVKAVWTIAGTTPSFNFGIYLSSRR